jgi:hypothetical protein
MAKRTAFPHAASDYTYDAAAGAEEALGPAAPPATPSPCPGTTGRAGGLARLFQRRRRSGKAVDAGLAVAGGPGATPRPGKAQRIYANYLEKTTSEADDVPGGGCARRGSSRPPSRRTPPPATGRPTRCGRYGQGI